MSFFRDVMSKPWEHPGLDDETRAQPAFNKENKKVALTFFLVIVGVLFSLLVVSYFIRMTLDDWAALSLPSMLWLNTAALALSSVLLESAKRRVRREDATVSAVQGRFFIGGAFALAFIAGQYIVWQQLAGQGRFLVDDPAAAFFYLLTGLHILHLLGGLWVWSQTCIRLLGMEKPQETRLSIELCTTYWHFLLLVWLGLFYLLATT